MAFRMAGGSGGRGGVLGGLTVLLLALILLPPDRAPAGVYKWVDGQGNVHFTDDPGRLPEGAKGEATYLPTPPPSSGATRPGRASAPPARKGASPPRAKKGRRSEAADELLRRMAGLIEAELPRDREILGLSRNWIAIKKARSLLAGGLPAKMDLIEAMKAEKGADLTREIRWLATSYKLESELVEKYLVPNAVKTKQYHYTYVRDQLRIFLPRKEKMLAELRRRIAGTR